MNDFKILTTQISYFGYQLTLPIDSYEYKWIATDSNGDVLAYTHKPIPRKDTSKFGFDRNMHGLNFKILANVKFQGNWADSLVEIVTLDMSLESKLQRFNTHFLTTVHADKVHKSVLNFWHAELQQFLIPEIQQEYEKWTAEQKS